MVLFKILFHNNSYDIVDILQTKTLTWTFSFGQHWLKDFALQKAHNKQSVKRDTVYMD